LTIKWNGARIDAFLHAKTVNGGRERVFPDSFNYGAVLFGHCSCEIEALRSALHDNKFPVVREKTHKSVSFKTPTSGWEIEKKSDRSLERRAIALM
jgi:hypothetical protein